MQDASPEMLSIFAGAIERPSPEERVAFLHAACGTDAGLRRRVEALLRAHDQAGGFLRDRSAQGAPGATVDEPVGESAGDVIGPYKLLERIGEGGFGMVFLAGQAGPVRRNVALKVLKPGMDTRQVVARFEAERQALALMDHPNIARVFDGGTTPSGRPYFVMELVKGAPVTDFCDQHHLSPRQRLELFVQVCQAVQHAHQKGVIHRDVKPSNVLVSRHDTTPVVKVIDFGVAKAVGQELTEKTLFTGLAQLVGTPLYMSPEQAGMSDLDVDTRSDIYSLGVLLYELLTGTTPFDRERFKTAGYDEIRRIIREEDPPKPSTRLSASDDTLTAVSVNRRTELRKLVKLVRGELDWIVMKALEKDRTRRYDTANSFAADVQRYLADEPVQACPPSAGYRLRKFARRNRGRLAVAAGLFLGVTVMAASIGWAVADRAARRSAVEGQVRASLDTARTLIAENKLGPAREKLAQARAQLGGAGPAPGDLAAEVAAAEAELNRLQEFLDLIDRAHQVEIAPGLGALLAADDSQGNGEPRVPPARTWGRRPAAVVPVLLEALRRYRVLEADDWNRTLAGGLLGRPQVEQIRHLAYEELLWLAHDVLRRKQGHTSGESLSDEAAARQALAYLSRAENARAPTRALYTLRARCRKGLGDEAGERAEVQLADQTPATTALDHTLQGQAAYDAKQLAEAVQSFESALRLEPTHYWSLMWLGYCLTDLGTRPGDFAEATRVFTGCILKRPDHAHAYTCRGIAHAKLRRYPEALTDYSKAIELDPRDAIAWDGRGVAHNGLRQPDKAAADICRAIDLDPNCTTAWYNLGVVHNSLGQPDKAVEDYSKAVELDPTLALAWYGRGNNHALLGEHTKAVADYSRAIELDPTLWKAFYNRGNSHNRLGQPAKAVADFSKAIELDPMNPDAWCNRGVSHLRLGQPAKAVADYSRAIELNPRLVHAWVNRGNAHDKLGERDKALADYSRAIELNPKHALAWGNRGVTHNKLGESEKAVVDFSRAIDLNPKNRPYWDGRGVAYARLGQLEKAVADYTRAIDLDPGYTSTWNNRGVAHSKLGQLEKAVADYSKAIELDPNFATAWHNRGIEYRRLQQPVKAVADYSKAIELDPKEANHWRGLGVAHYRAGDWKAAVAALTKSLELSPDGDAYNWLFLAMARWKLGQHDEARKAYERAVQWLEKNTEQLSKDKQAADELSSYREEAEKVLELKKK